MHPYRVALSATIGTAICAGVAVGAFDALLAARAQPGMTGGDTFRVVAVSVALYGLLAVVVGALEGIVAGAVRATYPEGATVALWRRIADDPALDRRITGTLLAGCCSAAIYAAVVAVLSLPLVGAPARKTVGALLLGGAAALLLPLFALGTYPFYRVTRHVARIVPRLGPVPATVVLVVFTLGVVSSMGTLFVLTRLEWEALPLGAPVAVAAFVLGQAALLAILYWWPLAAVRRRVPGRPIVLSALLAFTAVAPFVAFSGEPSERAIKALLGSRGARPLVMVARRFSDADGDGHSALLGGPDCNDRDGRVHPGATDVPGNGVDENCNGADAPVLGGAADAPPPPPDSKTATFSWKGNILVIAVDTLRADRVGAISGYTRRGKSLTPRLDELVKRGVVFTHAYAQAPRTPTSFPSIFTSRWPSRIQWGNARSNYPTLLPENVTLFEALRDAGFQTIGESSHFYFTEERGITQGFTAYSNAGALDIEGSNRDVAAPRLVPRVAARLAELAAKKQRFVLFTHLFEPHSTYVKHDECEYQETEADARWIELYDCEVAYVDLWLGKLVDELRAAGLADNTMIVILSDHGEELREHRSRYDAGKKMGWHGTSLTESVLRVPLLFVVPGLEPRAVDEPVMLVDLAPTLLDLVKAPAPKEFQGRSLKALLVGEPLPPRPAYAELVPYPSFDHAMKALIRPDGKKVIWYETDNDWEVFDLRADPGEQRELGADDPALARELKAALGGWIDALGQ